MKAKILILIYALCMFVNAVAQLPEEDIIYRVARAHINNYFPGGAREIISMDTLFYANEPDIFVINIKEGGWILISGDKRTIPVLGFDYEGFFAMPDKKENITSYDWIFSYSQQIKKIREEKSMTVHQGWKIDAADDKGMEENRVVVEPLIKTKWNQGAGWNRFCPEDSLGPGGHTYVGCVAVAMAQALSVYQVPDTGTSTNKIYREDYGIIEAKFNETHYIWDSMSLDEPDDYNSLLLFHCAVAVNMNFGPDGSSARTSDARSAMGRYFKMTKRAIATSRAYTDEDVWVENIINDLILGRPIIYSGNADDGESGHAFNIDGVNGTGSKGINYFHLNWGWGGNLNGYYLIDDLTPGNHDYSENHLAVFKIQPYYYPTDVILNDTLVPVGAPAGTAIGLPEVVDEAYDNDYEIIMISDSVYQDNEWINEYYLENDSVKTGRVFTEDDIGKDTVRFIVTDKYDNTIEADVVLEVTLYTGSATLIMYDYRPDKINIYPNPAKGIINIDISYPQPAEHLRIYSQSGLMVREIRNPTGHIRIDTDGFSQGLYIVEIRYSDGSATRQKVLIL
ncbi:MAG: C10 family peptidase [Bacteroidales bacterium]|nr:C10 family peptidase [Bacteroidales bacterium]